MTNYLSAKNCGFCETEPEIEIGEKDSWIAIICAKCGTSCSSSNETDCVTQWNRIVDSLRSAALKAQDKPFPIMCYGTIPWGIAKMAYAAYAGKFGASQSLERLAERGGFSVGVMDMFYPAWREEVSEIKALKTELQAIKSQEKPVDVTVARFQEDLTHEGYVHLSKTGDADQETLLNKHLAKAIAKKYPNGIKIIEGGE